MFEARAQRGLGFDVSGLGFVGLVTAGIEGEVVGEPRAQRFAPAQQVLGHGE